jgi:hypothetical protein
MAKAMIASGDAVSLEKAVIKTKIETAIHPIHKGAGYYEMPDGSRIRGKEKAYKELKKWQ